MPGLFSWLRGQESRSDPDQNEVAGNNRTSSSSIDSDSGKSAFSHCSIQQLLGKACSSPSLLHTGSIPLVKRRMLQECKGRPGRHFYKSTKYLADSTSGTPTGYVVDLRDDLEELCQDEASSGQLEGEKVFTLIAHFQAFQGDPGYPYEPQDVHDAFVGCGGIDALVCLIDRISKRIGSVRHIESMNRYDNLRLGCHTALYILREASAAYPFVGSNLMKKQNFIDCMFRCMKDSMCFEPAVSATEEMLASSQAFVDLTKIDGFQELVMSLSPQQTALMCRLIALVILDPDGRGSMTDEAAEIDSVGLLKRRRQVALPQSAHAICNRNHAIILNTPGFCSRLCRLLVHKLPDSPTYDMLAGGQVQMILNMLMMRGPLDSWGTSEADLDSSPIGPSADLTVQQLAQITHRVEVIFVICTLLGSKRKHQAQALFFNGGLLKYLNHIMKRVTWNHPPPTRSPLEALHGPECGCNPESAIRVQLLRLIMAFCDRDPPNKSFKSQLLNEAELESCKLFAEGRKAGVPVAQQIQNKGLIGQVIELLASGTVDSMYSHWMISVTEAFLRLSPPGFQMYAARSGILKTVLDIICTHNTQTKNSLQLSFDALCELLRFNSSMLRLINDELVPSTSPSPLVQSMQYGSSVPQADLSPSFRHGSPSISPSRMEPSSAGNSNQSIHDSIGHSLGEFMRATSTHLVDSNCFLRSLLLTTYFNPNEEVDRSLFFVQWLEASFPQLIADLMLAVSIEDLGLENLCVINTTLLTLLVFRRQGRLKEILDMVRETEKRGAGAGTSTGNYRTLLSFWQNFYSLKSKDSVVLQQSTGIHFSEWKAIVAELMQDECEELGLKTLEFYELHEDESLIPPPQTPI